MGAGDTLWEKSQETKEKAAEYYKQAEAKRYAASQLENESASFAEEARQADNDEQDVKQIIEKAENS